LEIGMGPTELRPDRRSFVSGLAALLGAGAASHYVGQTPAAEFQTVKPIDLEFSSALDAAGAIRRKQVSSVELTRNILARVEKFNPKVNAIVTLRADEALGRAKAADDALARGEWWGPFHGVPCTVKDTFETAGVRTTAGAPFLAQHVRQRDAAVVERLKAAGAVILGKTNTPFMAGDHQTFNDLFGTTNNPWDTARTPGGSSGGSAAAVAAGLSYLDIGSDLAGSIRVPAHYCGVYGHKPSLGVVPLRGHIPPPPGGPPDPPPYLPVAGPLARSPADLGAALIVLGGPDRAESVAYRWSLPPARGARLADYRIGYVLDDQHCPVLPDVKEALSGAVGALRQAGARLEKGWPARLDPADQYEAYLHLFFALSYAPLVRDEQLEEMRRRAARLDGSMEARMAQAAVAPHKAFVAANGTRMSARAIWEEYFRTHDAFLMPTGYTAAPPHDHAPSLSRTVKTPTGARPQHDLFFWSSFASLAGLPATIAPAGRTPGGLPVGLQIAGPFLEDATPIAVAGHLAELIGGFRPPANFAGLN
jgi:amidase